MQRNLRAFSTDAAVPPPLALSGQIPWVNGSSAAGRNEEIAMQMLSLMKKRPILWSIAALLLIGLSAGLASLISYLGRDAFVAVASLGYSTIPMDKVDCVSIDSHVVLFDGKDYSDPKLAGSVARITGIRKVFWDADYSTCHWGLAVVTSSPEIIVPVRYFFLPANYRVAVGLCERRTDGKMNSGNCVSKNIYIFNWFNWRMEPHDLFSVALVGLTKQQTNKWERFEIGAYRD